MQTQRLVSFAALALLGSSATFAQSSVTLYGRINTSIERSSVLGMHRTGVNDNASRFGLKGVEDLGGGLKAGFQLESGFDSSTGEAAQTFFGRQSEVNLSGSFGKIRLGNWIPESYYAVADYGVQDQPNHDTGSFSNRLYQSVAFGHANKIGYRTPEFGGFWAEASVSAHEKVAQIAPSGLPAGSKYVYDLAANWERGPLAFGAGYAKLGDNWDAGLRGHYTVGAIQVAGYYQRNDYEVLGTRNSAGLAAQYAFGASEVVANYIWAGKWSNVADSSAQQLILGYNYHLSKRTKVYAAYTLIKNESGATYGYRAGRLSAVEGFTPILGGDPRSVGVGVRHNF
ncbi:porin [Paracidovorax citrulli]|uniref:porin n=1 Tax=Paracidovorax citrulli TaxID=80869 RepID=UPI0006645CB5|nr:porin [Paracidovorax citrulli]QCX10244.1 Outer membrane porin protein 32 [Paracidovorax citrulli]UEG46766.1 porin [Paracidovorax citrulli]UMT89979.1 porin [Paracidovorax citrulli]UMT94014.1 porin [Paracidovorax citrulli]WIY35228.1 porin [Paracidovorax citrulli]